MRTIFTRDSEASTEICTDFAQNPARPFDKRVTFPVTITTLGEQNTKSRNKREAVSAKSRNHYRAIIRQFLTWAVRKDYLSSTHRLFEADAMRPEHANTTETEFYTASELGKLLECAKDDLLPLLPLVAIGGLAGLRRQTCYAWTGRTRGALRDTLKSRQVNPRHGRVVWWKFVPRLPHGLNPTARKPKANFGKATKSLSSNVW